MVGIICLRILTKCAMRKHFSDWSATIIFVMCSVSLNTKITIKYVLWYLRHKFLNILIHQVLLLYFNISGVRNTNFVKKNIKLKKIKLHKILFLKRILNSEIILIVLRWTTNMHVSIMTNQSNFMNVTHSGLWHQMIFVLSKKKTD